MTERLNLSLALSMVALALGCAALVLVPSTRKKLRKHFSPPFREVLSTVTGDVLGNGKPEKILKVQTRAGLFIEVYDVTEKAKFRLQETIKLRDPRDGHFLFNGESSNLVLDDINGDQKMEILAPSFDKNFKAHLNVFTYSKNLRRFVEM